jgi:magnesium chelatase family protein
MSLSLVQSRTLVGLNALSVCVEVHLANGLPGFTLVGLADTEVKESRERVRSALLNAGLEWPSSKRITVNLAPADLPKESGRFDLPIAVGILAASGQIDPQKLQGHEFAGELSLGGELRPIRGALAMGLALLQDAQPDSTGIRLVLPPGSAEEAALVRHAEVYRARHLLDVVARFAPDGATPAAPWMRTAGCAWRRWLPNATPMGPDLAEVKGQTGARRALEIAAAGQHSILFSGPPGSGKSMLAQRLAGLLPPMDDQQALETAAIASLAGRFSPERWGQRPTCAPHHTASAVALVGGGSPPRPGEISLAHHGVLFLDELPEFPRSALEALREPLETGRIRISRAARQTEFPAQFQLVGAMNPCPCGYLGPRCGPAAAPPTRWPATRASSAAHCWTASTCTWRCPPCLPTPAGQRPGESTATVRQRVAQARQRAVQRQGHANQGLQGDALEAHAQLAPAAAQWLKQAAQRLGWSGRATHRAIRVARTIADLAGSATVETPHMAEALQYRRTAA